MLAHFSFIQSTREKRKKNIFIYRKFHDVILIFGFLSSVEGGELGEGVVIYVFYMCVYKASGTLEPLNASRQFGSVAISIGILVPES